MQVLVPKRNFFAKLLGTTLFALTLSLGANAMQQDKKAKKVTKTAPVEQCDTTQAGQSDCGQTGQLPDQVDAGQTGQLPVQVDVGQTGQLPVQIDVGQGQVGKVADKFSQMDIGQAASSSSSSSQQQCGFQAPSQFSNQCGDVTWLQTHHQSVQSWNCAKQYAHGHVGSRLQWQKSNWQDACSQDVDFDRINLNQSKWNNVSFKGHWGRVHLDDSVVLGSTLSGRFVHSTFNRTHLVGVTFANAEFRDVDAYGAHFEGVTFDHVDLDSKHGFRNNFDGATFKDVKFIKTKIKGTTFRDTHFDNVTFECSKIKKHYNNFADANVKMQDGQWVKLSGTHLKAMGARLKKCQESQINLSALVHSVFYGL